MTEEYKRLYLKAKSGDRTAQYELSLRYKNGHGCERNHPKWIVWACKSAEQGDSRAIEMLESTVIPKLQRVCDNYTGDEITSDDSFCANRWLGYSKTAYEKGGGKPYVQPTYGSAYRLQNAKKDSSMLLHAVSDVDLKDLSLECNNNLQKAKAEFGSTLGNCLEDALLELSLPKEVDVEVARIIEAAKAGNPKAQNYIGVQYRNGTNGFIHDDAKGAAWYRRASVRGYAQAQANLAQCYESGVGVQKNKDRALEWWHKAAEENQVDACAELGYKYLRGLGLVQDYDMAADYLLKAANQEHSRAQYLLSNLYMNGNGVPQDVFEAIEWCVKAARSKEPDAIIQLDRDMDELVNGLREAIHEPNSSRAVRDKAYHAHNLLEDYRHEVEREARLREPMDIHFLAATKINPSDMDSIIEEDIASEIEATPVFVSSPQAALPVSESSRNCVSCGKYFSNEDADKHGRNQEGRSLACSYCFDRVSACSDCRVQITKWDSDRYNGKCIICKDKPPPLPPQPEPPSSPPQPPQKLTKGQLAGFVMLLVTTAGLLVFNTLYPLYIHERLVASITSTSASLLYFVSYLPLLFAFICCWLTVGLSLMMYEFNRLQQKRARRYLIPGIISFGYFFARCLHHIVVAFRLEHITFTALAISLAITVVVSAITLVLVLVRNQGARKALIVFMMLFAISFAFTAIVFILTAQGVTAAFNPAIQILTYSMHVLALAFIPTIMVATLRIKTKLKIKKNATIIFVSLLAPFMALVVFILILVASAKNLDSSSPNSQQAASAT